ncbi:unnamed protein product [Linum tenue]|uniref:NAC domain-containing protein n=1 Tax=Linum tenue TaxID=586396 RepID=A0AAV0IND9_9ROSI|nr:unnamed protein product [Linum tenue]
MSYIPGLPPGFRFDPTDDVQLILDYLCPKLCQDPNRFHHPNNNVVFEADLYDDEERWKNWFDLTGESRLYFFTRLKKKKKEKGKRVERSFGQSVWKSQKDDKISLALAPGEKEIEIGTKRSFSYKVKDDDGGGGGSSSSSSRESKSNGWVMHEFKINGDLAECLGVGGEEYVICCVRKKEEGKSNGGSQWPEIELIDAFPSTAA